MCEPHIILLIIIMVNLFCLLLNENEEMCFKNYYCPNWMRYKLTIILEVGF